AGAVVHGDADPPLRGPVGAASVPEAPVPDEDASFRHLGRDGLVGVAVVGGAVAHVRPGHQAGGPVLIGEVGEGPHGVAHRGRVGLGQGYQLVVGVDGLSGLTRADGDGGQGRDQAAGVQDLLHDGQNVVVDGYALVELPVGQQVVDAHRAAALEVVAGRHHPQVALEAVQVLTQGF